jgi:hypothetical protein
MSEPSETDEQTTAADSQLADRLGAQRPVPSGVFRGALSRHLAALDPGHGPRPPRLRAIVALYSAGGALLMALGTLLATGTI